MTYDTLEYAGVEKKFSDWGFSSDIHGRKQNSAVDEFSATIVNTLLSDEANSPTFPFEAVVTVRTNRQSEDGSVGSFSLGTTRFKGKRVGQPMRSNHSGMGVTYKFNGPWYDLENTHYQQTFKGGGGVSYVAAEAVLNTSTAVTSGQILISVGDQIQAILQWLLDQYSAQGMDAPFKYVGRDLNAGVIDMNSTSGVYNYHVNSATTISVSLFSLFFPSYISKPLMCSDALGKCAEFLPRMNYWFDYSTSPPTFHATTPADKTSKTLPLWDGTSHKNLSIQKRDDLRVRAVNILYRITDTINGAPIVTYAPDKWGPNGSNNVADPGTGLRVISELIDLQGAALTTTTGHLDVEPLVVNADTGATTQALKRSWWASKRGGEQAKLEDTRVRFQDKNHAATTIPDATIVDAATGNILTSSDLIAAGFKNAAGNLVLNRIVRGSQHSWMKRSDGQSIVSKKVKLFTKMTYAVYDITTTSGDTDQAGKRHSMHNSEDHHVNLEITNGTSGNYSTVSSSTPGENYIIGSGGISKYLYDHLNADQYDGETVHVRSSFSDLSSSTYLDLGCSLNLSNGSPSWASMNAQIQSIEEDYFHHTISVSIGVAKHLNSGQLSSLLNMWRNRRPWFNPAIRSDNSIPVGGTVDMAVANGNANTAHGVVNSGAVQNIDYAVSPSGATPGVVAGAINNDPKEVTTITTGKTPIGTATEMVVSKPRATAVCDNVGNIFEAAIHRTEGHT